MDYGVNACLANGHKEGDQLLPCTFHATACTRENRPTRMLDFTAGMDPSLQDGSFEGYDIFGDGGGDEQMHTAGEMNKRRFEVVDPGAEDEQKQRDHVKNLEEKEKKNAEEKQKQVNLEEHAEEQR